MEVWFVVFFSSSLTLLIWFGYIKEKFVCTQTYFFRAEIEFRFRKSCFSPIYFVFFFWFIWYSEWWRWFCLWLGCGCEFFFFFFFFFYWWYEYSMKGGKEKMLYWLGQMKLNECVWMKSIEKHFSIPSPNKKSKKKKIAPENNNPL